MDINSPCVRNCCLSEDDVCMGCFRSLEEIKQWSLSSDDLKQQILLNAQSRRSQARNRFGPVK